jgi:hypothetical protein
MRTVISSGKYDFKSKGSGVNCGSMIQFIDQSGTVNLETFIATIDTARNDSKSHTLTLNLTSLLRINKTPVDSEENNLSVTFLNPRSVKNKTLPINDFILDNNIDILALTETWLDTNIDKTVLYELTPNTHKINCVSRQGQRGGGTTVVYNININVDLVKSPINCTHFELLEFTFSSKDYHFRLRVIYRPPSSRINKSKIISSSKSGRISWILLLLYPRKLCSRET